MEQKCKDTRNDEAIVNHHSLPQPLIPSKVISNLFGEGSCLQARKRALMRHIICQHLDLGPLSLQNYEK